MDQSSSRLLALPKEIRLCIWEFVLVSDEPITFRANVDRTQPALLQTCNLIRSESKAIYYAHNRFHFIICNWYHFEMHLFANLQLEACNQYLRGWEYDEKKEQLRLFAWPTMSICKCPETTHSRRVDIANLKLWLYGIHLRASGSCDVPVPREMRSEHSGSIGTAENVAFAAIALVMANAERPWEEEVKPMLETLMAVISQQNVDSILGRYKKYLFPVMTLSQIVGLMIVLIKAWELSWWILRKLIAYWTA